MSPVNYLHIAYQLPMTTINLVACLRKLQYPFVGKILKYGSITEVKGFTHLKTRKKTDHRDVV